MRKFLTAAVAAALVLTLAGSALAPFLTGQANGPVAATPPDGLPRREHGATERALSEYRNPHDRLHNMTTRSASSCWVRTRYGTANVCDTDGRAD